MASLSDIYLKKETLETILKTLTAKNATGINLTISINDESNEHGKNISMYVAQTKEEQQEKKKRFYVGYGKTFWNDGKIVNGKKPEPVQVAPEQIEEMDMEEDLPF